MTETSISEPLEQRPVRDFKFRSAFSLSFADLSPIVGIYTVFAIGLIAAGPAFLWAFPLVLVGQLMVCGVFGNLVSVWPLQGSVYAWSRELIGPRYGWFTGWAYMWGLTLTLAVLPITAAPYILGAAGVSAPSQIVVELVAIGVLLFGSIANVFGGRLLKGLIYIALVCELVASAGIGHHPADLPSHQPAVDHLQHRRYRSRRGLAVRGVPAARGVHRVLVHRVRGLGLHRRGGAGVAQGAAQGGGALARSRRGPGHRRLPGPGPGHAGHVGGGLW